MQIMPLNSPWNEDISRRPVLANSAVMIAQIKSDLSASRQTLRPFYEMNYVLVPDNQPRVPIPFFNYPDESDLDGGSGSTGSYPIPSNLPIETWPRGTEGLTLEQWQRDVDDIGGDRHAIIVMPGAGSIWETWLTRLTNEGWEASNGAKFDLANNALRPAGWTSADAAGLPMFPALVRYDECERGMVEHALRLVVAKTRREYIYPATHYASSIPATATTYPAMGQRLRLKASFSIRAEWTKEEKAVLLALKKYGAIVADNGGFFSVSVCPDDRFAENAFDHLSSIDVSNFEVIQTTGPSEGPRSPGGPVVDAGPEQFVEISTPLTLNGSLVDETGAATVRWTLYAGPGNAVFSDAAQPVTTATFDTPGTYTLMLSADDGVHTVGRDIVAIHVSARASFANISTRMRVGAGVKIGVGGFIIVGAAPKKISVRAIGPSLTNAGVGDALIDPVLELYDFMGKVIASNDDWKQNQEQAIRDAQLAPSDSRESAIVISLQPGSYTAVVRSKTDSGGVALVETYDLEKSPESKLANISTRGAVGTGEEVMIAGLIVAGPDAARVLFRGIGPSLRRADIPEALSDPQLEVVNSQGNKLAGNNNWEDSQQAAIAATGAAPEENVEAAIIVDLPPGNYTALLSGLNGGTGVGLVEAYHLQ